MSITDRELKELTPENTLDVARLGYVMRQYYCKQQKQRGKCKTGCELCNKFYTEKLPVLLGDEIKDPYALLVYLIRNQLSNEAESTEKGEAKTSWKDDNPFEMFLTQL